MIVRQGDTGDRCFFIESGEVEVLQKEEGQERQVAILGSGALFGEASLLTEAPRNATVRATKPCRLFALARSDFLETLSWNKRIAPSIFELLRLRDKPARRREILIERYTATDGEKMAILKDPTGDTYFRLSPLGQFVWERLDGHHNLKDISLEYLEACQAFYPHPIAEIIAGLVSSGFAQGNVVKAARYLPSLPFLKRLWIKAGSILQWRLVLRDVDPGLSKLYQWLGLKYLYSKISQAVMLLIAAGGIFFFITRFSFSYLDEFRREPAALVSTSLVSLLFIVLIHDTAHAFTTKYFGREVRGIGIGWHWFSPILYVDTSDMWPMPPKKRILVHLAGLYVNLFFAGIAALLLPFLPTAGKPTAILFALLSYFVVILNAMPILQLDGHYAWKELKELKAANHSKASSFVR